MALDAEQLAVLQVLLHDAEDALRQAHAKQRVRDFSVTVHLAQLEQVMGNGGGILRRKTKPGKP